VNGVVAGQESGPRWRAVGLCVGLLKDETLLGQGGKRRRIHAIVVPGDVIETYYQDQMLAAGKTFVFS
jgi:hypothetical protein